MLDFISNTAYNNFITFLDGICRKKQAFYPVKRRKENGCVFFRNDEKVNDAGKGVNLFMAAEAIRFIQAE